MIVNWVSWTKQDIWGSGTHWSTLFTIFWHFVDQATNLIKKTIDRLIHNENNCKLQPYPQCNSNYTQKTCSEVKSAVFSYSTYKYLKLVFKYYKNSCNWLWSSTFKHLYKLFLKRAPPLNASLLQLRAERRAVMKKGLTSRHDYGLSDVFHVSAVLCLWLLSLNPDSVPEPTPTHVCNTQNCLLTNFLVYDAKFIITLHLLRLSHGVHLEDVVAAHSPCRRVQSHHNKNFANSPTADCMWQQL